MSDTTPAVPITGSAGGPAPTVAGDSATGEVQRRCRFPGCVRPPRPDPATGRPTLYCEQPGPDGGPVHNRASAWRARRASQHNTTGTVATPPEDDAPVVPVSMARASLEQRLERFPEQIEQLRSFLDGALAELRTAGDVEAAAAEVADAHREALAKITAAEQQLADAERARRTAQQHAVEAEALRAEADAAAEAATAETTRIRDELTAELHQVRADAEQAAAQASQQVATAAAEAEQARTQAATARGELAALHAQAAADRETITMLRADLDQVRADGRAEREVLQRAADERADALTRALDAAQETIQAYRAQRQDGEPTTP